MERAVQLLTDAPASLFGLRDRGRVETGHFADLVLLDPQELRPGDAELVHDLPGNAPRLVARPEGVEAVFVNGVRVVEAGRLTAETPGTLLRSGRDTVRAV